MEKVGNEPPLIIVMDRNMAMSEIHLPQIVPVRNLTTVPEDVL